LGADNPGEKWFSVKKLSETSARRIKLEKKGLGGLFRNQQRSER